MLTSIFKNISLNSSVMTFILCEHLIINWLYELNGTRVYFKLKSDFRLSEVKKKPNRSIRQEATWFIYIFLPSIRLPGNLLLAKRIT